MSMVLIREFLTLDYQQDGIEVYQRQEEICQPHLLKKANVTQTPSGSMVSKFL